MNLTQHFHRILVAGCFLFTGLLASSFAKPAPIRSWGYQLTDIRPSEIARSPYDLIVIDPTSHGSESTRFTAGQIAKMKVKPDGSKRLLFGYLSIGEAEQYRGYWKKEWKVGFPPWLDDENTQWPGNYKVHYWHPEWQEILLGSPAAALDKILSAGFDGVYLDLVDAFEHYESTLPLAARDMVSLVSKLRRHAKGQQPAFQIVAQNAERLVNVPGYLKVIDGIAREDLSYGQEREGLATNGAEQTESLTLLRKARDAGKFILTVDYVSRPDQVQQVQTLANREGFIAHAARDRELDQLTPPYGNSQTTQPQEEVKQDRDVAALFNAATVPEGEWRLRAKSDWHSSKYTYDYEDETTFRSFNADDYWELTTAMEVSYGFTDWLEIGVSLPLAVGYFAPAVQDRTGQFPNSVEDVGLGNIRLLSRVGWEFNEGNDFLLLSAECGLPTDTRREDLFAGYSDAYLDVTWEHYWDGIGFTIGGALEVSGDKHFRNRETNFEWQAGFVGQITNSSFASLTVGGRDNGTTRLAGSFEILLHSHASIDVYTAVDVSGPEEAISSGIALTWMF